MKTILPIIVTVIVTISFCYAQNVDNTLGDADQPVVFKPAVTNPEAGLVPLLRGGSAPKNRAPGILSPLLSGTYEVGDNQPVLKKLTDVAAQLNSSIVTGNIIYELNSTYDGTTGEVYPIVFNQFSMSGGSWTVTIRVKSGVSARTTSGNTPNPLITFDGADYMILDGRAGGTGSSIAWNILNNHTDGTAIGLMNDAKWNNIRYCDLAGTNPESGVVLFGSTTGTDGNDYNTIEYCNIHSVGANFPRHGIYCSGNTASVALYNSNNTVQGCNIYDYSTNLGDAGGIYLAAASTAWTITGNSIYQTGPRTSSTEGWFIGILVEHGDGYIITNNYLGGSAPLCGGPPLSLVDINTFKAYLGIVFGGNVSKVNPNSFQGNTVTNIYIEAISSLNGAIRFCGLLLWTGYNNIGNLSPNVVGSATATDAIKFVSGPGGNVQSNLFGIWNYSTSGGSMMNNVVGGITLTGNPLGSLFDIQFLTLGGTTTTGYTMSGNLVGSLTNPASLQVNITSTPFIRIQSIYSTLTCPSLNISQNTVANITLSSGASTSSVCGIRAYLYSGGGVINSNIVRDLTSSAPNTSLTSPAVCGVNLGIPLGVTASGNSIYSLKSTNGTAAVAVMGLLLSGASPNTTILERNLIHSLTLSSSSSSAGVYGIYCPAGMYTMKNNMIRLGLNADGTSLTKGCRIYGIYDTTGTAPIITESYFNNSIYIGGTGITGVTKSTFCFYSTIPQDVRTIQNNIFWNARSGGTTGKHYAIQVAGTGINPIGLNSNNNILYSTVGPVGYYNADRNTLADWQIATGQDMSSASANPNFLNPGGPAAVPFNLHVQSPTPVEGGGIAIAEVTNDFDGEVRSGLTPTDIGADAGNFTSSGDIFGPTISYALLGNTTATIRVLSNFATITDNTSVAGGVNKPRIYFKRSTDANAFVGNTSNDNGWKYAVASNSSSPYSFTIDHSLLWNGGPGSGMAIQYFVVAQDVSNNLSSNPAGAAASTSPPVQNLSAAPPAPNSYYVPGYTISGTLSVGGAGATYTTLTGTGGLFDAINKGIVTGNMVAQIKGNLTEPGTVALSPFFEEPPGSNFTLTIVPGDATEKLISGAVDAGMIRFDGADRVTINGNYGGSGRYLRFRNTSTSGPTLVFQNDATSNNILNSIIEGANTKIGVILIGTTTLNAGNDNNTFSGNVIRDRSDAAGIPSMLVYSSGITFHANSGITITNNELLNFSTSGIFVTSTGNGDGWTITGNSFYNNLATPPNSFIISLNFVPATLSSGNTISNNYIGGSAANCGGLPWKHTGALAFYGIYVNAGTNAVNYIQNNVIRNITLTSTGGSLFYGIYSTAGIFNVSGNTIGNMTGPASIITSGTGAFNAFYFSNHSTLSPSIIQNNQVSGIAINGTGTGQTYGMAVFAGLNTVINNIIGNPSVAGAITINSRGSVYGIYSTGNGIFNNNTIANLLQTNATPGSCTGIQFMGTYSREVVANTIMNLGPGSVPTVASSVTGIFNWSNLSTVANNLISLGHGNANNCSYTGISDALQNPDETSFNYYNSISIGGSCTGNKSSYAFGKGAYGITTLRDNICSNTRVNATGGSGKHYAVSFWFTSYILNSDYNDLYTVSAPLALWSGTTDVADLAGWQSLTGNDLHSKSANPEYYSAADLHVCSAELDGTGIAVPGITTDFIGATRGDPPGIGAYEFNMPVATIAANQVICFATQPAPLTSNVTGGDGVFSYQWQSSVDQSVWTNIAGATAPTYQPPVLTDTTMYRLHVTYFCDDMFTDEVTIHVTPLPTGNAGEDDAFCENETYTLNGSAANYGSVVWTTAGDGTFNNAGLLNATYTPGDADIAETEVTLTLTVHALNNCPDIATDQVTLEIGWLPTVNAGDDGAACEDGYFMTLGWTTNAWTTLWTTSGDGYFEDPTSTFTKYWPGDGDIAEGEAILTLTATTFPPCSTPVSDQVKVTFIHLPGANAGPNATICASGTHTLSGAATNYSSVTWTTSGDGTFNNIHILNAVYTPGVNDIANESAVLTLTSTAIAPCQGTASDAMTLTITGLPQAYAGADGAVCTGDSFGLAGATASNYGSLLWTTSGSGTFVNPNVLNATYIPSQSDIADGTVALILTANAIPPCSGLTTDAMVLTITAPPTAFAGDNFSVCSNQSVNLAGTADHYASVKWTTAGDGTFNNLNILNPVYTPGTLDYLAGSVYLTLTAFAEAPCDQNAADEVVVTIVPAAFANAGPDDRICGNELYELSGVAGGYFYTEWTSSGDGKFNDNTVLNAMYEPGTNDILLGYTNLTLTAWPIAPCLTPASDMMVLLIDPLPEIPGIPTGSDTVCVLTSDTTWYSTLGAENALSYIWDIFPEEAGTISGEGTVGVVDWSGEYFGSVFIKVKGVYDCGEGDFSEPFVVLADPCPGVPGQPSDELTVMVYPNPSDGKFNLKIINLNGKLDMSLMDITGQILKQEAVSSVNGFYRTEIDISTYPQGVYFLRLQGDNISKVERLVVR